MCRFAAYVGPALSLSTLLYDLPHSLEVQSYKPREQHSGHVNVDGTGVVWWPPYQEGVPLRYVSEKPPWSDPNLPGLAPRLEGSIQMACVRSATPGMPFGSDAVLPFLQGSLAFAHNGFLTGFRKHFFLPLLQGLPSTLSGQLESLTDSRLLFMTVLKYHQDPKTSSLIHAVGQALQEVQELCYKAKVPATLNLLLGEPGRVIAVRASIGVKSNSLYYLQNSSAFPSGGLVASEPLDPDLRWEAVPHQHMVVLELGQTRLLALDLEKG